MPIALLKTLMGPWEKVRGGLFDDLERIEMELNLATEASSIIGTLPVHVLPNVPAGTLLGRGSSSGSGPAEEIDLGPGLYMDGTTLRVNPSALGVSGGRRSASSSEETGRRGGPPSSPLIFTPGSVLFAGPTGLPSQDNAGFAWDDTNNVLTVASATALAATSTDGLVLTNPAAATSGVLVQMSPRLRFRGSAWDGAATKTVDAFLELLPQSGTPRGLLNISATVQGVGTTSAVQIGLNPTTGGTQFTLGNGAAGIGLSSTFRGGDGTAASPVFGAVQSGGGSSIGFWFPAPNDMNLVCGSANQILWGVGLWRNGSALSMAFSSNVDPNLAVGDVAFTRIGQGKLKIWNNPEASGAITTAGFVIDMQTDAVAKFRDRADAAYATVDCLDIKTENATFVHRTGVALTNNAAAALGTLTNAPAAGNPTKWIAIDDNGTTRFIPAW